MVLSGLFALCACAGCTSEIRDVGALALTVSDEGTLVGYSRYDHSQTSCGVDCMTKDSSGMSVESLWLPSANPDSATRTTHVLALGDSGASLDGVALTGSSRWVLYSRWTYPTTPGWDAVDLYAVKGAGTATRMSWKTRQAAVVAMSDGGVAVALRDKHGEMRLVRLSPDGSVATTAKLSNMKHNPSSPTTDGVVIASAGTTVAVAALTDEWNVDMDPTLAGYLGPADGSGKVTQKYMTGIPVAAWTDGSKTRVASAYYSKIRVSDGNIEFLVPDTEYGCEAAAFDVKGKASALKVRDTTLGPASATVFVEGASGFDKVTIPSVQNLTTYCQAFHHDGRLHAVWDDARDDEQQLLHYFTVKDGKAGKRAGPLDLTPDSLEDR